MTLSVRDARVEALFCSTVQPGDKPGPGQVDASIAAMVRRYGSRTCAARVAQEFGEHPELAAPRMRWARDAVAMAYPQRPVRKGHPSRPAGSAR